jgi:hypothetical protein
MMQQRAQQFLMGDPDEQASMMTDAQMEMMQQQMGEQPIEGEEEVIEAEEELPETEE